MGPDDAVGSSFDDRNMQILMSELEEDLDLVLTPNSVASITERWEAKCGFNAEGINTAPFRTTSTSNTPVAGSPYLTIPPGICPTALLDLPTMLPNYQALPSPTTGTFSLHSFDHESSSLNLMTHEDRGKVDDIDSFFQFKPHGHLKAPPGCTSSKNQGIDVDYHELVFGQAPMDFKFPAEFHGKNTSYYCSAEPSIAMTVPNNAARNSNSVNLQTYQPDVVNGKTYPFRETIHQDGYNWRKYGQKHVKGSECPRSYYKCTHPKCQATKKVERLHDGQITEIIYKGAHKHAKPAPNRRVAGGSLFSYDGISKPGEDNGTYVKGGAGSVRANFQSGATGMKIGSDGRTPSLSVLTKISDPLSAQGISVGVFDPAEAPELSSTFASHNDEDDVTTQGSTLVGDDDEESESKRRKTESCLIETNMASRALREPRVSVQIESEVDILDDGYRWRKYGQKVVKGNPNPRSYYKCTSVGCVVRKHIERASHNLKYVITTYEGKHNHEVPAARNSNHMNSSTGNIPTGAANAQQALTLPRNFGIQKHEIQDFTPHFDIKSEFSNKCLRPMYPVNFSNEIKCEDSSIYQMRFPLQCAMPFNSFGPSPNGCSTQQAMSMVPIVPEFPMSLPSNHPFSGCLSFVNFDFNDENLISQVQSLLSGQQRQENDMRLPWPKQEQKDDNLYDSFPLIIDNAHPSSILPPSSSSSISDQIMGS